MKHFTYILYKLLEGDYHSPYRREEAGRESLGELHSYSARKVLALRIEPRQLYHGISILNSSTLYCIYSSFGD